MNKNQWFVLSITFWLLMFWFIFIDYSPIKDCNAFSLTDKTLDKADIWCLLNAEMFDPFIYLFGTLGIVFFICGGLEKEK